MTFAEWKKRQDEKYGEGTVDTVRKTNYNKSTDKKQYDEYKQVLGKDAPKKFDDFRNIKYFEPKKYAEVKIKYANAQLQNRIKSGKINTTVLQGKHIKEHNNFIEGRSYLKANEDVQVLVNKYAGTGRISRDVNGKWDSREFVKADHPIGIVVSKIDDTITETLTFIIHYRLRKAYALYQKRSDI